MGLDKPQDLVWMFIIFAVIVVTFGFFLTSLQETQGVTQNSSFFANVQSQIESDEGLMGAANDSTGILTSPSGVGDDTDEAGFIKNSFNSLRNLGKVYAISKNSLGEAQSELKIDPIYIVLLSLGLLITFAAVLYTWLRAG